jgi:RNA polymerase sigma factor (sigma-70 family)
MPPPPAQGIASSFLLAPALKVQPDRRLVDLVRDGYETAFEEIVRRYGSPLRRYAAAIVGGRAEDVTQDAFSKAFQALRRDESEIDLRPWLYRIVRNTALNDLRDRPPTSDELDEAIAGGRSAAEEAERREEVTDLMTRLRALPEPQRAAIVMRELEGLSHEEIATALGVTGGAARQFIYRARVALRDGVGLMIPIPLLKALIDHGAAGAGAATAGSGVVAAGASLGGAGTLKVGVLTAVVAGSIGAGVAAQHHASANRTARAATPAQAAGTTGAGGGSATASAGGQADAPRSNDTGELSRRHSVGSTAAASGGGHDGPPRDGTHTHGPDRGGQGARGGPSGPPGDTHSGPRGGRGHSGAGPYGGPAGGGPNLGGSQDPPTEGRHGSGSDSGGAGGGGGDTEGSDGGSGSDSGQDPRPGPGPRSNRLDEQPPAL